MSGKDILKSHVVSWQCERCIQTGKMLHLPAKCSRSLGQQLGKRGYQRSIAWPVTPEDDWCP